MGEPIVEYVMSHATRQYYEQKRRKVEQYFVESRRLPEPVDTDHSPSGRYTLEIESYNAGSPWRSYKRVIVRRVTDGEVIADIKRNFDRIWWKWVEHPDGNEYLLCGEDYQGYSVINLTQGVTRVYFPDEAIKGVGFCWTAVYPSPDGLTLAVDGCIWAALYETVFYDFSDPRRLPLLELGRIRSDDEDAWPIGWETDNVCAVEVQVQIRKSDGAEYRLLSAEEQDVLDHDSSLSYYMKKIVSWQRPKPGFSALAEPQR